jgi:hypothetical protein
MDVDHTRTLKPPEVRDVENSHPKLLSDKLITQTCYRCGQTGHISRDCDLRHDVRHIMLDEQDEFIQQIMANRDAAVAAAAESTTQAGTSEGTLVEREVDDSDFVRSNR